MATSVISGSILDPSGAAVAGARVVARLLPGAAFLTSGGATVLGQTETATDTTGAWALSLERQSNITPGGTYYEVTEFVRFGGRQHRTVWYISVPDTDAELLTCLITPPVDSPAYETATDAVATAVAAEAVARDAAIAALNGTTERVFNVAGYSVVPGVTVDCGIGIQQAIDAAFAAGGGKVVIDGPGTYTCDLRLDPAGGPYNAMFWMRSGVHLDMGPGVIIKLKSGAVAVGGATQLHLVSTYGPYRYSSLTTQSDIKVTGGIIDGNGDNQTLSGGNPRVAFGLFFGEVTRGLVSGVKVRGLKGTTGAPPGETMHFEANNCNGVTYFDCEADGTTATDTATGFSSDGSTDVSWTGCVAYSMAHGMGFTNWQSAGLRYVGCKAYRNGYAGFNAELGHDVIYSACQSGGISSDQSPYNGSQHNPFYTGNGVVLGNAGPGFQILGCTDVQINGTTALYNQRNVLIANEQTSPLDIANTRVIASDCSFMFSTLNGSDGSGDVVITGAQDVEFHDCVYTSSGLVLRRGTTAPFVNDWYRAVDGGGANIRSVGHTQDTSHYAFRWWADLGAINDPVLGINGIGQFVTQGVARTRRATAGNTTITARDHVIAVTSTAAARTITLPAANAVAAGTEFIVKDESGAAATNNITVAAAGSDTIEGAATRVIAANYGAVTLYSNGVSQWYAGEADIPLDTPLVVPAAALAPIGGSPTLGAVGGFTGGWLLDASSDETLGGQAPTLPAGWSTFNIDLAWTNAGAGTGNIVLDIAYGSRNTTESLNSGNTQVFPTITAPAQNVLLVSQVVTGAAVVRKTLNIHHIGRIASNGGDTLTNDCAILALIYSKAS